MGIGGIEEPATPRVATRSGPSFCSAKAGMSGVFRGGMRQEYLKQKFTEAEGREIHELEFFGGSEQSNWTVVNTKIGENQKCTLGFQLVYGKDLQIRVKELFREYVSGAHAHYKFEIVLDLKDKWGGNVFVEVPDHRPPKRGQYDVVDRNAAMQRQVPSGADMRECLFGRVALVMKKMDGPVENENQSACLCCS
jgi:hypothetical protein